MDKYIVQVVELGVRALSNCGWQSIALAVEPISNFVAEPASPNGADAATSTSSGQSSQPTSSPPPSNNGGGGGPTSSPLLFFVALGFGVVFTNLW